MTSYYQRHVYFNQDENARVSAYLLQHHETFSGLMKRLLAAHLAQNEELLCVSAAPTSTTPLAM